MRNDIIVKISIIMPVYNDEKYLSESINTVLNQTLTDLELICINDGSTDNSLKILEEFKQKYDFIKIITQYNQGSGKARNTGIEIARGDYIAFLDSDDRFIDKTALEKMYETGIKYDANMVSANLKGITVKNELVNNNDGVERFQEENVIKDNEYGIPYAFYKNIFKRSFLNKYNFRFPDLKRGQDPVFLSNVLCKVEKIPVLPLDLYGFRYAPTGGLSKINTFEKKWDYIKHFRETFEILKQAQFNKILEDYKEKLFLYINHGQNSSDEVVYTIVHEIFKDDAEILKECEGYFKIETQVEDLVKANFNKSIIKKDDVFDLKIKINELELCNKKLNYENKLLTNEKNKIHINSLIYEKIKLDAIKLLDENRYFLKTNYELRKKIRELYSINEQILSKNINYKDTFFELNKDQFDYYNKEYNILLNKQNKYDKFIHDTFSNKLNELSLKEDINLKKISTMRTKLDELKLNSLISNLRNKNIAYVLYGFPTLSETFILNELRWLRKNNINVKVFSYMDPSKPIKLDFDIETYRFDKGGNLQNNLEELLINHNIDLMHTHFVYPTGTKFTFPLAKKLNIPFTLFAHAFDIFIKEHDKINNINEISNSELCKGIFTLSNYHKNYLIKRGVPDNKIILTRQATEYDIKQLIPKNTPIKQIVSISRFVEKKGLDVLIECANLLKDENLEFSIFGFGPLEEELTKRISELKLNNISIKGVLNSSKEVEDVFNKSDLLISPCKIARNGDRDGIPTVIFESMGYGVPVLTTSVSAIPEVITDNTNGFIVNPNDPEELANKIKQIMEISSENMLKIRETAQKDVQEISSIEKTMFNVLNIWNKIN